MRLARFATTMVRRRRIVVAVWAVILVAAAVVASSVGSDHRVDYSMPGSGSARAQELLGERFPEQSGDTVQLVFAVDGATLDSPAVAARIAELQAEARTIEHVTYVRIDAQSPDGTVALATVQLDATAEKVPLSTIESLMELADHGDDQALGLTVEAGGGAVQTAEMNESGSEGIGLMAALIILLIVFGSVLAAGLPILVAVF
ncbi:MAG: MMPL family transporter [Actinobacteria bacterium]|nr:MMPL family transporter [Actinomycetota bacterium]